MTILNDNKKYRKRIIDDSVERYLAISGALCIEGPKWCGKTWTSAKHSKSALYIGDPSLGFTNRRLAELNPLSILDGGKPRLIDEWQEVPAIWDAVRAYVDQKGEKGQIILTGSSTPKRKGIMHSGAGRIFRIRMDTMSLFETGDSTGLISLKDLCDGKLTVQLVDETSLIDLAYYIVRGGWPGNVNAVMDDAHLMPRSYINSILSDDVFKLDDEVYDTQKVRLLLKSLARNESTTVSNATLLRDINENDNGSINKNSMPKYLDLLNRLFLTYNQEPFSPNIRSSLRVKQMEKRHFSDPAIAAALLNITPKMLLNDLNTFGFLFESLVEHDLRVYAESFGGKLYHYQDYNDNEIDAVIELPDGEWCAFEIKLGANMVDKATESLNRVCKDIENSNGKKPKIKCVICGLTSAAYQTKDGIFVVPLTALKP